MHGRERIVETLYHHAVTEGQPQSTATGRLTAGTRVMFVNETPTNFAACLATARWSVSASGHMCITCYLVSYPALVASQADVMKFALM